MTCIFKLVVTRRDNGYTLSHDVIYFTNDQEHEQCDVHGNVLHCPIFTLSDDKKIITEDTNPDEFATAKHATYSIISEVSELRATWTNALSSKQTIFTYLSLNIFSDLFTNETLR